MGAPPAGAGTAAFGRPLDKTAWDLTARNELLGAINQRNLRTSTSTPTRSAVRDGHVYIAYRNRSGQISLDVDQTFRSLTGSAPLARRARAIVRCRFVPRPRQLLLWLDARIP